MDTIKDDLLGGEVVKNIYCFRERRGFDYDFGQIGFYLFII